MYVKYSLLNKLVTNRKTQHFVQSVHNQKVIRNCLCKLTRQPNKTFGMRVKHAIRQKALNILWCLTRVKHKSRILLTAK